MRVTTAPVVSPTHSLFQVSTNISSRSGAEDRRPDGPPGDESDASRIRIFVPTTLVDYVHPVTTFVFSCTDPAAAQSYFLPCLCFVFT